jgi:hypothetical protein
MFQTSNDSNTTQSPNYCVNEDGDGNPYLVRCSALRGHPTVAAAKETKIEEIQNDRNLRLTHVPNAQASAETVQSRVLVV